MKIYTKKGDAGETGLYGNTRVSKDDQRIQTYGTVDELNAVLGLVLAEPKVPEKISKILLRLQNELFQLGAELATPQNGKTSAALIEELHVTQMEKEIDEMEAQLSPLQNFILPGGSKISSLLHFARTVSRRAERELTTLHHSEPCRPVVLQYLNRLSDHLFVVARFANHLAKTPDIPWVAPHA